MVAPEPTVLAAGREPQPLQSVGEPQTEPLALVRLPSAPPKIATGADKPMPSPNVWDLPADVQDEPLTDLTMATAPTAGGRPGAKPEEAALPIPSAAALEAYARVDSPEPPPALTQRDDPAPTVVDPSAAPTPMASRTALGSMARDEASAEPAFTSVAGLTTPSSVMSDFVPSPSLPEAEGKIVAPSWPLSEPEQAIAARITEPTRGHFGHGHGADGPGSRP